MIEKVAGDRPGGRPGALWRDWTLPLAAGVAAAVVTITLAPAWALLLAVPLSLALTVGLFFVAPRWALITLLVSFYNPVVVFLRLNLLPWSYALTLGLFAAAAVVLLLRRRERLPAAWQPVGVLLAIMMLTVLAGALRGLWLDNPLKYVVSDSLQALELMGFVWLTVALLWHFGRLRFILAVLALVFLATVAWEQVIYAAAGSPLASLLPQSRALKPALAGESLVLAGFSPTPAAALPILATVLLLGRGALSRRWQLLLLAALVLSVLSVALSLKRSIWVAELGAGVVIFLLACRVLPLARIVRLAVAGIAAGALLAALLAVAPRGEASLLQVVTARMAYTGTQLLGGYNPGVESRRSEYDVVLQQLGRTPLLGAGLGAQYVGHTPAGTIEIKHFMHNTFLAIAFRMGLLGVGIFLVVLVLLVLLPVVGLHRAMPLLDQALAIGALGSFCMLTAQALTTGTLLTHPIAAYGGFLLGMAHYLVLRNAARRPLPAGAAGRSAPPVRAPLPPAAENT